MDPFCGSGTVIFETARRGIDASGFEINPAAYAMAKFYTLAQHSQSWRAALVSKCEGILNKAVARSGHLAMTAPSEQYRESIANFLLMSKELISKCLTKDERLIMVLTACGAESSKMPSVGAAFLNAFRRLKELLICLPQVSARANLQLADARCCHERMTNKCDLVITSPPYVNVFNYHQNHRALMELLEFNLLEVAASEIGSNRKNRGNRFRTVIQYAIEMHQVFVGVNQCLNPHGKAVFVVGRESSVRSVPIPNSNLVCSVAELSGFGLEGKFERSFRNRFGATIWEDILVFNRTTTTVKTDVRTAADTAASTLDSLLPLASTSEVRSDIQEAIRSAASITPSPILTHPPLI